MVERNAQLWAWQRGGKRRLRRTDLTYNRRRAGVRRSSDGRHVCQCRNLSRAVSGPGLAKATSGHLFFLEAPVLCYGPAEPPGCGSTGPTRTSFFAGRENVTGIRIFFPQHFFPAYGIIDNVCIDAWSSTVATGLVSLSLSLSQLWIRRLHCAKSCRTNAFSLFEAVMVLNGNIFRVLLLVTCCIRLPTVIGDKKEKGLFFVKWKIEYSCAEDVSRENVAP